MATHAKLSASGAERWLACPGSIACSAGASNRDSPYAAEGTAAHEAAAICLSAGSDIFELIGVAMTNDVAITPEMAEHVQAYLDYVRSQVFGDLRVEETLTDPDLGSEFGGTPDLVAYDLSVRRGVVEGSLHVTDLKYGAGIAVEADKNSQLKYYAYLALRKFLRENGLPYDTPVDEVHVILTVVQPRAFHPDGAVRSVLLFGPALMVWGDQALIAGKAATEADNAALAPGEHCRFCPAKTDLICPALRGMAKAAREADPASVAAMTDDELGAEFEASEPVKMYLRAIEEEVYRRLMNGRDVPGTKLVAKRASRVWIEGAEALAREKFGDACMSEPEFLSPAALEKALGSPGKAFAVEHSHKQEAGYTVALLTDKRPAASVATPADIFGTTQRT